VYILRGKWDGAAGGDVFPPADGLDFLIFRVGYRAPHPAGQMAAQLMDLQWFTLRT